MAYTHKVTNGINIVELDDSIDLYSTPPIKKFLKTLLNDPNRKIVISMEKVTFLDSSGLGMVVNLFFECKQKGIGIRIANISPEAERIFHLTKKKDEFKIYSSVEVAIDSFG